MQNNKIDLLVTFDKNYIVPFRVMLTSAVINNPGEKFVVWLLQSSIPPNMLRELEAYCNQQGVTLNPVSVDCRIFADAPVSRQYPQEMYYRLLAPQMLPSSLKKSAVS